MGQKISVKLFRAYKTKSNVHNKSADPSNLATSVWYARPNQYSKLLLQDIEIRKYIEKELAIAGLVQSVIRRQVRKVEISIFVTKPGLAIGKAGSGITRLKNDLVKKFALPEDLKIDIQEYRDPYKSAVVIANELSDAIKRGASYRKLAKTYLEKVRYSGVLGAKILLGGRLNGAEIARKETFTHGSVPRHTIDSNIDFANVHCKTKAGIIGIKVWLYKGDKFTAYTY
jgi:small subunit ribosomal protein S3